MPFWWRRRKKPWFTNRYRAYRRRRWPKRRRRRIYKRRRTTRLNRRRRKRRRYKVRRKKPNIIVRQWQPDSIRKCKIKGMGILVLGAEGSQIDNFTVSKCDFVPPKVPWGGSSGLENITLEYLYEEHVFKNNIWTTSNIERNLCRYLRCRLTFFRHPDTDFIIAYNRQPPYFLNKYSFPGCHPQQLLLEKHKIILLSQASKPNSKYEKKVTIRPPKQMLSKWFFTKDFSKHTLLILKGAAANLRYSYLSRTNENMLCTIYSLNTKFYQIPNWDHALGISDYYRPYGTIPLPFYYKDKNGSTQNINFDASPPYSNKYYQSISWEKGWFSPSFLQAKVLLGKDERATQPPPAVHQVIVSRYNPNRDSGKGNKVWCISTQQSSWLNASGQDLVIEELPLWLALYGYFSWVSHEKPSDWEDHHVICIKSPAIYCYPEIGSCDVYCPIDFEYIQGKKPYGQALTEQSKKLWMPNMHWQKRTLNCIVESGPFVPQYSEETSSTWELKYNYSFYFKWGGPLNSDQEVKDPKNLDTYDVPDTIQQTIKIINPTKQTEQSTLYPWDYRRGYIKERAIKRMCEDIPTDTEFQCSTEETPKKRQRMGATPRYTQKEDQEIQACLQTLCEKNTFQEQEDQTIQQLINQQQQQQEQIKYSIVRLLMSLKEKQRALQYHTGLLD
nr:MAG: ORF1 [Torque teno midi virus]